MNKLDVLILDDEKFCCENLSMMLEEYCPEVRHIEKVYSAKQARETLETYIPDVIFLDINMPHEDGFTFLESLEKKPFSIVFTTAHNEFAMQALKANALDYLEKPINIEELQQAVQKVIKNRKSSTAVMNEEEIKRMVEIAIQEREEEKTAIPTRDGFEIVKNKDIINLEASESYTLIYLKDGKRYLSSKNIKVYEEKLNSRTFFRIHKSHIINVGYHLKGFKRNEGNVAVMSNGKELPISRRKLQQFLDRISNL